MRKIISLFQRNYDTDRLVRNEVVPGAEWVMAGEGVATQKIDGTACLVQDGRLYKRFDAKRGKTPPSAFLPAQDKPDPVSGHWPGWVPVEDHSSNRWHLEAWTTWRDSVTDGTYELVGPKVQGNPEQMGEHCLIRHGATILHDAPRDYEGLKAYLQTADIEGIVWWRDTNDPDCDKVKIKARDFGIKRGELPGAGAGA